MCHNVMEASQCVIHEPSLCQAADEGVMQKFSKINNSLLFEYCYDFPFPKIYLSQFTNFCLIKK